MSTLSKKLMTGTALAACLILSAPATTAQRGGNSESHQEAEARRRAATEQERAEAEARHRREVEEATRKEREAAERRRAASGERDGEHTGEHTGEHAGKELGPMEAKRKAAQEHKMTAAEKDKALRKIRGEEERHRDHLARIHRLRELAKAKGQAERLAALDKLEAKENKRYEAQVARRKEMLGDKMHRGVEEHLKRGRGHEKDGTARGKAARKKLAHEKDAEAKKQKAKATQAEHRDKGIQKKSHEKPGPNDKRGGGNDHDDDGNGRGGRDG
ncbi:MAG: hypothetical protein ACYTCU_05825 [Planctomycetota bacterium]|jgi:hypothetical protein